MKRIYIPTTSPDDWRKLLAEPDKQWRSGFSAKEMAISWEEANGFPREFQEAFHNTDNPDFQNLELLLAIPEYQVSLPGGGRPSQNDLFVLARTKNKQLVTITVEGKVSEPFGKKLGQWLKNASDGKRDRLQYLCDTLGLSNNLSGDIRYQLLHRTASAIIEADRFNANYTLMIVHSFSRDHKWFEDYQAFLNLFDVSGKVNQIVKLIEQDRLSVYAGWITGQNR